MTEAAVAHLPIVVVTADRPWELHGLGANQTVPQAELFAHLDVGRLDLPAPPDGVDDGMVARQLDTLLAATSAPCHINARFRKPLEPPADAGRAHATGAPGSTDLRTVRRRRGGRSGDVHQRRRARPRRRRRTAA